MRWTKFRETVGAVFAVALVVLLVAAIGVYAGWNIPILRDIADFFNIER